MSTSPSSKAPRAPEIAPYREFTVAATIVGVVIGALLVCAFVYICLLLGFGLAGSTVAAILGFAVLRGVLKKGSIVENNINQTIASGVNNASSGVAFTLPALFLLAKDDPNVVFEPGPIILSALAGSFLGIVFIIPLRKQMIEFERLRFPSGIAVASLLKSPGAGAEQAKRLLLGFGIAMAAHVVVQLGLIPDEWDFGAAFGVPGYFPIAVAISFASIGAGMLSGRGGIPFFLGAILAWWVLSPIAALAGWIPSPEAIGATSFEGWEGFAITTGYKAMLRPVGIGILIGGALAGVIASFPAIRAALKGLSAASASAGGSDEMPAKVLYSGIAASFIVLFLAAIFSDPKNIDFGRAILIAIVGTGWLALAGLIVAQATGMTDISPISGMSLIGVTLMYFLSGGNVVVSVILGVAVAIGIGQCADMMSDLKAGHLIGAMPKMQQAAQFAVAWIGVPIAVGVVYLLWEVKGFGGPGDKLTAAQGTALAEILRSLGNGNAPVDKYLSGAGVGLALGLVPISGLGVLVGLAMYLPFGITVTYGLGCLVAMFLERVKGHRWTGSAMVPVAAGFIIGEALTNLSFVFYDVIKDF